MMSGGAVFRASFAEALRGLGFEIERDKSSFRIKGFSSELCERTSQRRAEILETIFERCKTLGRLKGYSEAEILKSTSGRMAELVNLETRKAKRERSRAEVFEETRNIARELGLPVNYVEGLLSPQKKLSPEQKAEIKDEIFRSAVLKISDQHSHWNERDLTEVLAQEAQGSGLDVATSESWCRTSSPAGSWSASGNSSPSRRTNLGRSGGTGARSGSPRPKF